MNKNSFLTKEEQKKETHLSVVECLTSKISKKHFNESNVPDVGPELAVSLFGKIYGGDPSTGVVPGARPMTKDEFLEIKYKIVRDDLKRNGHDPDLAKKMFLKWYGKSFD